MILFQIYFEVPGDKRDEFEKGYAEIFEPALRRQPGFRESKLLRVYPAERIDEIKGSGTEYNYQFNFVFDTEDSRRRWAASTDHDVAWPQINAIAKSAVWRGYDVIGMGRGAGG